MGILTTVIEKELKLHQIKVISFDIFDTLLFRTVRHPDDVFEIVGKKAVNAGVLKEHIAPVAYKNLRKEAERRARARKLTQAGTEEVTLEEIMQNLSLDGYTVERLAEMELETEKEVCYSNPELPELIRFFYQHADCKVVLTSDMYLTKKQIEELIDANDLECGWYKDIFVSSEVKKNKKSGEMYHFLAQQCKCQPDEILHIGDNYISDVVNAQFCGLHTYFYDVVSSDSYMDMQMEQLKYGRLASDLYALRCYVSCQEQNFDSEYKSWFQIGARTFGPLLSSFAEWVLDEAEKEKIIHIFPLMREGYILSRLLKQAAKYRSLAFHIEPLYVSRKALFMPGLDSWNEDSFEKMAEIKLGSIGTVMEMLGLEGNDFREIWDIPWSAIKQTYIDGETAEKRLKQYMFAPEQVSLIQEKIKNEKQKALSYLSFMGLDNDYITVDLGMKGTMQKILSDLCPIEKRGVHLLLFGAYETLYKIMEGVDIRGYAGCAGSQEEIILDVVQRPHIWEQLMMCREGTTIGYSDNAEPITKQLSGIPKEQYDWIEWCHEGILAFQREFLNLKKKKNVNILPQDVTKIALRLVTLPTPDEVSILGKLYYDENYGVDIVQSLCPDIMVQEAEKTGVDAFIELHPPGEVAWMEGIVTQIDETYYIEKILGQSLTGYEHFIMKIVKKVLLGKPEQVVVAGAGEAGRKLQRYMELYGIRIEAFTDNNEKLQGNKLNGIPVKSLHNSFMTKHYVIASFAYAEEISKQIRDLKGDDAVIYRYDKTV